MTSNTEETGAATDTTTAQPKASKKARVAPRRAHVAPKKSKAGKKATPPKKAPQAAKKAGAARDGSKAAKVLWFGLSFDRVGALAVLSPGRGDLQSQLLPDGARKEATHGTRLPGRWPSSVPSGCFHPPVSADRSCFPPAAGFNPAGSSCLCFASRIRNSSDQSRTQPLGCPNRF